MMAMRYVSSVLKALVRKAAGYRDPLCSRCPVAGLVSLIVFLALVGVGCEPGDVFPLATVAPTPTPVRLQVNEVGESQGEPTKEPLQVNNCKGGGALETILPATKLYTRELVITPEPDIQSILGRVRAEILDYHKVENPLDALTATCSVPVNVPAGTLHVYEIEWTATWREGTVEAGDPDGNPEATYRLLESLSCKVVGAQPQPCPTE